MPRSQLVAILINGLSWDILLTYLIIFSCNYLRFGVKNWFFCKEIGENLGSFFQFGCNFNLSIFLFFRIFFFYRNISRLNFFFFAFFDMSLICFTFFLSLGMLLVHCFDDHPNRLALQSLVSFIIFHQHLL